MQNELMQFVKSDKTQHTIIFDKYHRNDTLTIIKYYYDKNNLFLYTQFNYENELKLDRKFEYGGFYNLKSNTFYDLNYNLRDILQINYANCLYLSTLKEKINDLIRQKASELINNNIENINAKKAKSELTENDISDLKYYTDFNAKSDAENCFLDNKSIENISITIPTIENITIDNAINYLDNGNIFINEETKNHIEKNLKNIYMNFLKTDILKKEFLKIQNDKTNILHLKRAINNGITDQKTVNVTIFKDNKEFTFKTEATSLKSGAYSNYYSTYYIQAQDRRKFEQLFGRSDDYTADEITKITYSKKPLYIKEAIA